jgi:Fe-S cluster assembly iron-binding protein IscA
MEITVDDDVKKMIMSAGRDYRICTSCTGPALVPTTVKRPKESDLKIPVGNNTLFVSIVQARYVRRITMDMAYNADEIGSCFVFY